MTNAAELLDWLDLIVFAKPGLPTNVRLGPGRIIEVDEATPWWTQRLEVWPHACRIVERTRD